MALYRELLRSTAFWGYRPLLRYPGFKLYLLLTFLLLTVSLLVAATRLNAMPSVGDLFTSIWLTYIWEYWLAHGRLLLGILAIYFFIFMVDVFEGPFHRRVAPVAPLPIDERVDRTVSIMTAAGVVALVSLTIATIPMLHLCMPRWLRAMLFLFSAGGALASYWTAIVLPKASGERRRLGSFTFRGEPSFDAASMGTQAEEVEREIEYYEEIRGPSPLNERVAQFIKAGDPSARLLWQGFDTFYRFLAQYLRVPARTITLHANTTAAIARALQLCGANAAFVTTDMEYPTVARLIRRMAGGKLPHIFAARGACIDEGADVRGLTDDFCEYIEGILNSCSADRVVVITSHVYYETGLVVELEAIFDVIERHKGRAILIVDGAQAAGNVSIEPTVFERCHFYATSGHKWLLGRPALGILIHGPRRLDEVGLKAANVEDDNRPFSLGDFTARTYAREGETKDDYSRETVPLEPVLSLNAMLVEFNSVGQDTIAVHNRFLAELFARHAIRLGRIQVITSDVRSGIVAVKIADARRIRRELEQRHDMICQAIDDEILRLSFHYYMGEGDVFRLLNALSRVLA